MAKNPSEMSNRELGQMIGSKPITDWEYHAGVAEREFRRSRYMFWSSVFAAAAAFGSMIAAVVAAEAAIVAAWPVIKG
jgi:hypothetical protein